MWGFKHMSNVCFSLILNSHIFTIFTSSLITRVLSESCSLLYQGKASCPSSFLYRWTVSEAMRLILKERTRLCWSHVTLWRSPARKLSMTWGSRSSRLAITKTSISNVASFLHLLPLHAEYI